MTENDGNNMAQQMMLNNFMQMSQGMAQQFMSMVQNNLQHMNLHQTPAPTMENGLTPEQAKLRVMQEEFAARHANLWQAMMQGRPSGEEEAANKDRRFSDEVWSQSPFYDYLRQAYLINADFLRNLADSTPLEDRRMRERMQFFARQMIDAFAPSNFAALNPEFIQTALATNGQSIRDGIQNMLADMQKGHISMTDESAFEVGRNLAVTPGAVIYENELIQLLQYAPSTEKVARTPLLVVPPCINKFYIMDLQPENSFVRFMVEQGYTVFLISWKNPDAENAQTTWDDYLQKGPLTALEVVRDITGEQQAHTLGFCIGGTLLSSALAVAAARGETPAASLTLMTTLLDFAESGEINCLIDEASVAAREAAVGKGGLMAGQELANVFSFLRANDLVWQYVVGNYMKGGTPRPFDLLYWNCDSTNLAGPFLAWYLRNMYLENSLRVPGRLTMLGESIDLGKLAMPTYLMAAKEDHIVPWIGAYLGRNLFAQPARFVLSASGHIAGAINPASKNRRSYWTNDGSAGSESAEDWFAGAEEHPGSWWNDWIAWLNKLSGRSKVAARGVLGNERHRPIEPAPGRYVKQKATIAV